MPPCRLVAEQVNMGQMQRMARVLLSLFSDRLQQHALVKTPVTLLQCVTSGELPHVFL